MKKKIFEYKITWATFKCKLNILTWSTEFEFVLRRGLRTKGTPSSSDEPDKVPYVVGIKLFTGAFKGGGLGAGLVGLKFGL